VKAARESQNKLLALQALDSSLLQLGHKLKNLETRKALETKNAELLTTTDLKIAAETEASDVKHELSRCEVDVEQVVTRIQRDEAHLASGQGTPKELEQIQHELGSLAKRRGELEEVELEVMLRLDGLKERISNLDSAIQAAKGEIASMKEQLERLESEINSAAKKNELDRNSLASGIDPELLALYEKIRSNSDGVGAARLNGNQCEGCHLTLNAAEVVRIKALPEDEVVRCDECRRILIRI